MPARFCLALTLFASALLGAPPARAQDDAPAIERITLQRLTPEAAIDQLWSSTLAPLPEGVIAVLAEPATRSLLVRGTQAGIARVKASIEKLDVPRPSTLGAGLGSLTPPSPGARRATPARDGRTLVWERVRLQFRSPESVLPAIPSPAVATGVVRVSGDAANGAILVWGPADATPGVVAQIRRLDAPPADLVVWEKIMLTRTTPSQVQEALGGDRHVPAGIVGMLGYPLDRSILVRGTQPAIDELKGFIAKLEDPNASPPARDETVIELVSLQRLTGETALERIAGAPERIPAGVVGLIALPGERSLLVRGTADAVATLKHLVEAFEREPDQVRVVMAYQLQHIPAAQAKKALAGESGALPAGISTIAADARANQLVVAGTRESVDVLTKRIKALDQPAADEDPIRGDSASVLEKIVLQHIPADELARLVRGTDGKLPAGIEGVLVYRIDNSLLVRGTREAIAALKRRIAVADRPIVTTPEAPQPVINLPPEAPPLPRPSSR